MSEQISLEEAVAMALRLSTLDKVRLVEQVMANLEQDLTQQRTPRKSLYGMWSDVAISDEDIDEARKEIWGNFPREDI